jgi:hypothetical protein
VVDVVVVVHGAPLGKRQVVVDVVVDVHGAPLGRRQVVVELEELGPL